MRKYLEQKNCEPVEVICNKCGRPLKIEKGMLKEGCFHGEAVFGYFSEKDGSRHSFDLCEKCYDELTASFSVPVTETEEKELC